MFFIIIGLCLYVLVIFAERALVEATPHDIELLHESNSPATRRALAAVGQLRPALAALLLARLFIKVFCTVLLVSQLMRTASVRAALDDFVSWSALHPTLVWSAATLVVAALCAVVFFYLKKTGMRDNQVVPTLLRLGGFILFWRYAFSWLISREKKPPVKEHTLEPPPEPKDTPGTSTKAEEEEQQEMELLKSIVRFADVTIRQVMQPREGIVGLPMTASFAQVLAKVRESEFSRLPIFTGDLDSIRGILYVKDLLPHLDKGDGFRWQVLVQPRVLFVPVEKQGIELLEEFKKKKIHLAIVRDDGGKTVGIVTLEDILEEVTGDIRDEFDKETG